MEPKERFRRLVNCCAAPSPRPTDEAHSHNNDDDSNSTNDSHDLMLLQVSARALALLNAIVCSPARLGERRALREELTQLGLTERVQALQAYIESAEGDEGAPREGSPPTRQGNVPKLLVSHVALFGKEAAADEREWLIEQRPLEEFRGACVVLFTSIASNKLFDAHWYKLEPVLKSKQVGYSGVDGARPDRKKAREALWALSGERSYPQVFVDHGGTLRSVPRVPCARVCVIAGCTLARLVIAEGA